MSKEEQLIERQIADIESNNQLSKEQLIDKITSLLEIIKGLQQIAREQSIGHDNVNHPKHYNSSGAYCECGRQIECIDITRNQSFNIGNAMKYLWRHEFKGGIEDLRKANWYIVNEIERLGLLQDA